MANDKEILILGSLRDNSRQSLTEMSKRTGIPISTLYDKIKTMEDTMISRHTSLINFDSLGFNNRVQIAIKTIKEERLLMQAYLTKNKNVNSLFKITNGYDFLIEAIFKNMKELEKFIEDIDSRFDVQTIEQYFIIDDIMRESFLREENRPANIQFVE